MRNLVAAVERIDPLTVSGRVAAVNGLLIEARGGLTRLSVGARAEIYKLIRSLADSGVAVVVVSSEVEEVLGLSDRVLVIREGRVVHESAADDIDESRVLDLVMEGTPA